MDCVQIDPEWLVSPNYCLAKSSSRSRKKTGDKPEQSPVTLGVQHLAVWYSPAAQTAKGQNKPNLQTQCPYLHQTLAPLPKKEMTVRLNLLP